MDRIAKEVIDNERDLRRGKTIILAGNPKINVMLLQFCEALGPSVNAFADVSYTYEKERHNCCFFSKGTNREVEPETPIEYRKKVAMEELEDLKVRMIHFGITEDLDKFITVAKAKFNESAKQPNAFESGIFAMVSREDVKCEENKLEQTEEIKEDCCRDCDQDCHDPDFYKKYLCSIMTSWG